MPSRFSHDFRVRQGDWLFFGIVLSISLEDVTLDDHDASLQAVEANYPESDNAFLTEMADDLLPEALEVARAVPARLSAINTKQQAVAPPSSAYREVSSPQAPKLIETFSITFYGEAVPMNAPGYRR